MRLFVAVEVPQTVQAEVAEAVGPLRDTMPRLRWVPRERYHLTVLFLGSVQPDALPAVVGALGEACRGARPFDLVLDGRLGTFGRRVLWAGLRGSQPLVELAAAVRERVGPVVGLPDAERPFSAHLTLARAGRDPVHAAAVADVAVPRVSWRVGRVVLMESAGGYRVVEAVGLEGWGA